MRNPSKPHGAGMFLVSSGAPPWRVARGGQAPVLTGKIMELLGEQMHLLETAKVLSGAELESYERRSEQIRELIRFVTAE
jgi:hypothetical protein